MSKKILLVDDDANFRAIAVSVLKDKGYTVVAAASAAEAKLEFKVTDFALLIIDGQLPDSDGVAVVEDFRTKFAETPVLFISATWRDSESYHQLTKTLKCKAVLHKPIVPSVLAQEVEKTLGYTPTTTLPTPVTPANISLADRLAKLGMVFGEQLPDNLAEIEELIEKGRNGKDLTAAGEAARKAHMIRGTAASFGFPRISILLGKIEDALNSLIKSQNENEIRTLWEDVKENLDVAKLDARNAPKQSGSIELHRASPTSTTSLSALLVSADEGIEAQLSRYAKEKDVSLVRCLPKSASMLKEQHFDLIFIEAMDDSSDLLALTRKLREDPSYRQVPIAWIKQHAGQSAPAAELYSGIDIVLSRPLTLDAIHSAFHSLMEMRTKALSRLLVIDDDPNFIKRVEVLLSPEGMKVTSFSDTYRLFDLLDDLRPDVMILDIDMPGVSGFDVCRKLRINEHWHGLPVIFVSARTDWETRVAAFECGGDDYMAKPVVNAELLQKTKVWLERSRAKANMTRLDSLTEVLNHSAFSREAHELLEQQKKVNMPCSVALVHLTNLHDINEHYGSLTGDKLLTWCAGLLKRRFPIQSIKGRWSSSVLALAAGVSQAELEFAMALFKQDLTTECAQIAEAKFDIHVAAAEDTKGLYACTRSRMSV